MCGIAGIYRLGERPPGDRERAEDRALVKRMLSVIAYRGPDDVGLEQLGRATLGVRRLSILDIRGGHQPLCDAGGRVWAVQNGEIYNFPALRAELAARHPFRTRTDTELLPHLWLENGADGVRRLSGMFAFAVYDTRADTLMLARDAVGVKPLYVAELGERLLFASELKCLLCDPSLPRTLDVEAVALYLALGFVPGARTAFRAARKVRPGARVLATPSGVRHERWTAWPDFVPRTGPVDLDALADEVAAQLGMATSSMLLSDRPVGVLLSGGLDSSVMTALLPEDVRRDTCTFTIGFEDGGHHDERRHAQRVASHLGTRHRELVVPMDVAAELPGIVRLLDEPCADPAAVPAHLVARAAASEVTVLLSGTGGDETFGGYRRYRLPELLRFSKWVPRKVAAVLARRLSEGERHRSNAGAERIVFLRKLLEARSRAGFGSAYMSTLEPVPPWRWRPAMTRPVDPGAAAEALWSAMSSDLGRPPKGDLASALAFDHLFYLPDDLLLKEDRMTMGASVEGRVPYLDAGLVAYAARLPLAATVGRGEGKAVLRRLARRLLPGDLASRPKHGFSVPVEAWLRGPLEQLARDVLDAEGSGLFRRAVLRRWLDEHRAGRDRSGALWAALCFELWWREVGSGPSGREAAGCAPPASVS
uniref:asparagine synthase (glutamine-hydrolyzing) n=1 Tax=Eiseniibacteriota bacterium TaxID=2212470 RepID=A0A832I360_UNCEI